MNLCTDHTLNLPGLLGATRRVALPEALDAQRARIRVPDFGQLSYYSTGPGQGRPLVLVHSINAAPSAYEMKPLFERYRAQRPVLAPDLPGFGFTDRPDIHYTPDVYVKALMEFLRRVVVQPADLVALSLGGEFAARVAVEAPELVNSLTLLSPTGFSTRTIPGGEKGMRTHRVISVPALGQTAYTLLTTKPSIRFFLRRSFVGPVPAAMVEYAYATTHQPGARFAPLYFLAGQLFTADAPNRIYAKVKQRTLVLYDRDPNIDFDLLAPFLTGRANWQVQRISPTMGLPHWENIPETTAALDKFWASQG
ncbi:alpha/beta fold hydrolase [uncultured Thiodictyon sp.]|uniref:alpha/beta fold hydrolase n=1 Tax=uncultured Thiodictyon sp. TaxID=1846217 RepID=UPI0025F223E2|nr:alpha/beta fold hydrolase [uncultured Thiodictyon sp.]